MEKNNIEEIWKPVLGYEGLYEASSLGNVRSLNYNHTGKTKVMQPSLTRKGYLRLGLSKNGKQKQRLVHTLVITAFRGPIPDGLVVDHVNNIKTDNRIENLQLLTPADNTRKSCLGKPSGMLGKKHSPQTKAKISASEKGKKVSAETRAKLSATLTGRKLSEEHRARMKGRIPWNKGKKLSGITC